jgi:hypothetical protein
MMVLGENAIIAMEGRFSIFKILTPNLVSKVPNYSVRPTFLIKKVKNRGKFLFTYLIPASGVSSPKGISPSPY